MRDTLAPRQPVRIANPGSAGAVSARSLYVPSNARAREVLYLYETVLLREAIALTAQHARR